MLSGINTNREPVHGLARPRELVELGHEPCHLLPELRRLRLRDASVSDETPELAVPERGSRLPGGNLEVIEVSRQLVAVRAPINGDVEHPCSATVETLLDRPHPSGPDDSDEPGLGEHLDVVRDRALRARESHRELAH